MEKLFNRMGYLGLASLGVGLIGTRFVFVVEGGYRAVVLNKLSGLKNHVYGEGMHFRWPIIMDPVHFEIRSRPRLISSTTGTRDM
jgi:hypothetical protein